MINAITAGVFWHVVCEQNGLFATACHDSDAHRFRATPDVWWKVFHHFVEHGRLPDIDTWAQLKPEPEPKPEPKPEPEFEAAVGPKPTSPVFGPRDA